MGARQWRAIGSLFLLFVFSAPSHLAAQDRQPSPFLHAITSTLIDPTTYAPALITYDATMRDWNSSQPFFKNGFVETNARFTVSGQSGDTALSYAAGKRQILSDTLSVAAASAVHNVGSRLIEQMLKERFPTHRKAVATIGWVERIAVASFVSYRLSAPHYRQWKQNLQLSAELGLR